MVELLILVESLPFTEEPLYYGRITYLCGKPPLHWRASLLWLNYLS